MFLSVAYTCSVAATELSCSMCGKFHFVDLAGSERAHRTGNIGTRFKGKHAAVSGVAPFFVACVFEINVLRSIHTFPCKCIILSVENTFLPCRVSELNKCNAECCFNTFYSIDGQR